MRALFLALLVVLAAALALLLLFEPRSIATHDPVLRDPAPAAAESAITTEPAGLDRPAERTVAQTTEDEQAPSLGPVNGSPKIAWGALVIRGVVVADATGDPLPDYRIALIAAGERPGAAPIPANRRALSDDRGRFAVEGLPEPGPWNVYAEPFRPVQRGAGRRMSSVTATNPSAGAPVEIRVELGAQIEWTAPLPNGVAAKDLWVEIAQSSEDMNLGTNNSVNIRLPGSSLTAACRQGEAGTVVAELQALGEAGRFDWPVIKIASRDGLWAQVSKQRAPLTDLSRIVISEPLAPRGRITVQIDIPYVSKDEDPSAERLLAAKDLPWLLPHSNPGRGAWDSGLGSDFSSAGHTWLIRSDGLFQLGDLPLGQVEVGATGQPSAVPRSPAAPAYPRGQPRPGSYVPINLVRATAVHGDPVPVTVRMRKVR